MADNVIKTVQMVKCPSCDAEFFAQSKFGIFGIASVKTREEVDKCKIELLEKVKGGEISGKVLTPQQKIDLEMWLINPDNILLPEDVDDFIANI